MTGKNVRPVIKRDDSRHIFFGLHTALDRNEWEYPAGAYMDSLGPDISLLLDDEPERPDQPIFRGTLPWAWRGDSITEDANFGPRPPCSAAPYGWMAQASCTKLSLDEIDFADPASPQEAIEAIGVCDQCPVFENCRHFAVITETSPTGVWADRGSSNRFVNDVRRGWQERQRRRSARTDSAAKARSVRVERARLRRIAELRRQLALLEAQTETKTDELVRLDTSGVRP